MSDIGSYRKDMVKFFHEVMKESYLNSAGLKDTLEVEKVYEKHEGLFTLDAVKMVSEFNKKRKSRLGQYLNEFATTGFIARRLAPFTDKIGTMEAKATVTYKGKKIPYRFASVAMTNEADRARRKGIFDAREKVIRENINPLYARSWTQAHQISKQLGYRNYRAMCESLSGVDLDKVKRSTEAILTGTSKRYRELAEEMLEEAKIGVPLKEAEKHDISRLFRGVKYDAIFPKEKAVGSFRTTLKWLGIDLDAQKNVTLDVEERPKKSPRAFCMPMDPPDEVYLVTMPHGGYDDYQALFHEGGHTEHYANTAKALDPEFKYLGDNSVTESYAMLLEYVVTKKSWIEKVLEPKKKLLDEFLRYERMHKMYFLRRYSAKLRYELQLHTKGLKGMGRVYRKELEKALVFKHPENHYLIDVDSEFYAARYLRAWMLERQINAYLVGEFGERWYASGEAGKLLRTLWSSGQKLTGDEIAVKVGFDGVDPRPLIDELTGEI
jgi:hypothetical protein